MSGLIFLGSSPAGRKLKGLSQSLKGLGPGRFSGDLQGASLSIRHHSCMGWHTTHIGLCLLGHCVDHRVSDSWLLTSAKVTYPKTREPGQ